MKTCNYPDCNCAFDMGSDYKCLKGYKTLENNTTEKNMSALDKQIAGNHYKKFKIQPAEFCHKNNIPYLEATAIKYLCRWRDKGGFDDLDKAIHFIELLKEFESESSGG